MACRVAEEVCNPSTKTDGRASPRLQRPLDVAASLTGCGKSHGHSGPVTAVCLGSYLLQMAVESVGAP